MNDVQPANSTMVAVLQGNFPAQVNVVPRGIPGAFAGRNSLDLECLQQGLGEIDSLGRRARGRVVDLQNGLAENSRLLFNGRNLRVNYTATTVMLTDVGRPPVIAPQSFSLDENAISAGVVAATDPDLPADSIALSIAGNGPDDLLFSISPSGALTVNAPPDFENPLDVGGVAGDNTYLVNVLVTDALGNTSTATMTIEVLPVNDNAPEFTSAAAVSVPENSTAVQTLSASDADLPAQIVLFSLVGGADQGKFTIGAGNQLQFIAAPDFENPGDANADNVYEVQVQASDQAGLVTLQTILVTVSNANDAPLAVADGATADEDVPVTISVLTNDSDEDGNALSVIAASDPPHGTAVVNADGTITFTPEATSTARTRSATRSATASAAAPWRR